MKTVRSVLLSLSIPALLSLSACANENTASQRNPVELAQQAATAQAAAPASVASPTATLRASASPSISPVQPGASASTVPAQSSASVSANTSTAAKKEEAVEANSNAPSGEEAAEGPPKPNPLPPVGSGGNQSYAPVPGVDVTKIGAAAAIHGSPAAGQVVFLTNCLSCHGLEGKGGVTNTGSDDGTVPPLNPIAPAFAASAKGQAAAFAQGIDLFIQHGSRPAGSNPNFSMIPWGDQKLLTQQQIADVEAYVMQLNGTTWPAS